MSARLIVIYVLAVLLAIGVVLYLSTACSYQSFGPHKPDKAVFAGELTWVLKPGGILMLADWNQRDARSP